MTTVCSISLVCAATGERGVTWTSGLSVDTLTLILAEASVAESDEDKPGVILGYDEAGNLVSLVILDASRRVGLPTQIAYQMIPVGTSPQ